MVNRFVFTINNPKPFHWFKFNLSKISYCIVGDEKAPTTGTPHLQGYIETTARTYKSVQSILKAPACHVEQARGKAEDNQKYCSKENKVFEYGTPAPPEDPQEEKQKKQGQRTDWNWFRDQIIAGKSFDELILERPFFASYQRQYNLLLQAYLKKPQCEQKQVIYLWGPSGTGKSRYAEELTQGNAYRLPCNKNTMWWPGYNGETDVIVDELAPNMIPRSQLLTWTDRYPVKIQVSSGGNDVWLRAKRIIFTSNYPPQDIGDDAFLRRLTLVKSFSPSIT